MWVFTKRSFLSVVEFDPTKDKRKNRPFQSIKGKHTHVLVRARLRDDLEDLKTVVKRLKIEEDTTADYSYRAVIPRAKFAEYLLNAVEEIDYDSHFKEVVQANHPHGKAMHGAMMSVWSTMARLQPHKPYGGYSTWQTYAPAKPFVSAKSKEAPGARPGLAALTAADGTSYPTVLNYLTQHKGFVVPPPTTKPAVTFTDSTPATGTSYQPSLLGGYTEGYGYGNLGDDDPEMWEFANTPLPDDIEADADRDQFVIDMASVKEMILEWNSLQFSVNETKNMDEEAFELLIRLEEKFGVSGEPSAAEIDAEIQRIEKDGIDPAYTAAATAATGS